MMDYSADWAQRNIKQPDTIAKPIKPLKQPQIVIKRRSVVMVREDLPEPLESDDSQ